MKFGTFSVVVGSKACNAACPCCISKMTPDMGFDRGGDINWRNFDIGCHLARQCDVTTMLVTGKGEPALWPGLVNDVVRRAKSNGFWLNELQTNGIVFAKALVPDENDAGGEGGAWRNRLREWYCNGMTLICLSIMHPDPQINWQVMRAKEPYDFWEIARLLHSHHFSVRINCTLSRQFMRKAGSGLGPQVFLPNEVAPLTIENFDGLVNRCRDEGIEQLTVRDVNVPDGCDNEVAEWVKANQYDAAGCIMSHLRCMRREGKATQLAPLGHGAELYDYEGQNVSVNNCLTETVDPNDVRQLIYFPDGHLRTSWKHAGAIIL